ncbi:flagellar export chaperone FliS [Dickeya lacustris]|uniref:Flagellar secretion chaperone FliS n=1 Tax=Dickeya lacustris TaxID=2259638 RepID=A0ABY8G6I5_9GAMM|nr:flagellar export chaperone FliS [Dickeya lacustris]WFN55566.1 flagellar export chaperone FliS [Dickeya lacustris]
MYRKNASQAYSQIGLESAVMSASPHQLIVMLFDGAKSALVRARILIEQGDIINKGNSLSKAIDIISNGLQLGLDMQNGGELAENLSDLYDYMIRRLLYANIHNDINAIAEVEVLLDNIADAWKKIGPGYQSTTEMR